MRYFVNARFAGVRMTGVQRSAYEIVSRLLLAEGDDPVLLAPPVSEKSSPLPVVPRGRLRWGHPWEQLELARAAAGAPLFSPANTGPLAVGRQLLMVHDLFPVEHPEWFSRPFAAWYRLLWPRLLRHVALVATNSDYTRGRILERYGLPEEKVVTTRFAYDRAVFRLPDPAEAARYRRDAGLPERYILYVGSVEPRKNLATLARAWKGTRARREGVELVVAGGAAKKAVFNAAGSGVESLDDPSIRLPGYVPDEELPLLYGGAGAFVLPSLAEGFGLPVLEAMACGVPVICSDTTALPEVAGDAARLVPPLDAAAWSEAIDGVLEDGGLRHSMGQAGLRRASGFSWERTAREVRGLLEALR